MNNLVLDSFLEVMKKKGLGIDNAMDGVRLKYDGLKATNIKGFIGKK